MMYEKPSTIERPLVEEIQVAPPLEIQSEFLRIALEQGEGLGYKPKVVKGPFLDDFSGVMEHVGQKLKELHPSLTPEYVMPDGYQSPEVKMRISGMKPRISTGIRKLRDERRRLIDQLVEEKISPTLETQTLPAETLSVPPYLSQTKNGADCVGACFRMVFEGVTGWAPPQDLLNKHLRLRHNNVKVDDEVLMGIFQTDAFKAMSDKKVTAYELMGTDLAQIGRLSTKVKDRWPESDVFCTVYQSSRTVSDSNILHHNVLLEADGEKVVTHDPRSDVCGPFYEQSYEEFADRWAVSYNRAHLVVAK